MTDPRLLPSCRYVRVFCAVVLSLVGTGFCTERDSAFSITARSLLYAHNLEYRNSLAEGRTWLGGHVRIGAAWQPARAVSIEVGSFARRDAGEEDYASDARLVLSGTVRTRVLAFTVGTLDEFSGHQLPEALRAATRDYGPGIEEGLQLLLYWPAFSADLWVDWRGLNTPSQREHFIAGLSGRFRHAWLSVPYAVLFDHYGGEQYAPPGDAVRQNIAGFVGVEAAWTPGTVVREAGVRAQGMASAAQPDRDSSSSYRRGAGGRVEAWLSPAGIRSALAFYYGEDFECWEGDPLYRTSMPWYSLTISRSFVHPVGLKLDGGIRFDCVEKQLKDAFSPLQYRFWVALDVRLRAFLPRRATG